MRSASAGDIVFADVRTSLDLQHAKRYTTALRRSLAGGPRALVTGQPAVQADLDPIFAADLHRGEAIAVPLTLLVLIIVFGLSLAVAIPFVVAGCTIAATLGLLYLVAHELSMVTYVRNLVELIGLGLAVDYSLLVVHRYREELRQGLAPDEAVVRTIATAGRAVAFSGGAVAVGLGLLLVVPVPFIRSMGIGGLLIPVVSVVAALTLQPALLSLLGARLAGRARGGAFWGRLARSIMHRPRTFLAAGGLVMVALAVPAATLKLTPGSLTGIPSSAESVQGYDALRNALGGGLVTPTHVVIVDGGAAATERLVRELAHDPETLVVARGKRPPYVAGGGRYRQVIVANRHEWGAAATRRYVERLRSRLIPGARFPAAARVYAGGAPPQGVDFVSRTYDALPWLVLCVLVFTYLVLLRAFRSAVIPLKALVLNALSVAATYGVLADRLRPPDRGVDPRVSLRRAVRALDGLRGVHGLANPRGARRGRGRRRGGRARARADGGHRHGGRRDHGRGVRGLRRRPDRGPARVRPRPRGRGHARRDDRAGDPRPVRDGSARPLELVAAEARI